MPTISGVNLSWRLEMSLSVLSFLAQNRMIAMGSMDANTNETASKTRNLAQSNPSLPNDNVRHIIKNNGMQMIGGFVTVEIDLATFNFSMFYIMI